MAKRRDELLSMEHDAKGGGKNLTLRHVKDLSITIGLPTRKLNATRKGYDHVSTLVCSARLSGNRMFKEERQLQVKEGESDIGELQYVVMSSIDGFLIGIIQSINQETMNAVREAAKQPKPELPAEPPVEVAEAQVPKQEDAPAQPTPAAPATRQRGRGRPATQAPDPFDDGEGGDA